MRPADACFGLASARRARAAVGVLALLGCSTLAPQAGAADGLIAIPHPASGPVRSYFKLNAVPGSVVRAGSIELQNPTRRTLRVVLAAVDGETLSTLGSTYAQPGSGRHGATTWLTIAHRQVTVRAGAVTSVPIAVTVPAAARPGDYLAGVSVEALNQQAKTSTKGGVSIASAARYAIGVEIQLPGPRHAALRLTGASLKREPTGLTFFLKAHNSGNAILTGVHGAVTVSRGRRTIVSRPIEAGTFVSQTEIAYPVPAFGQRPSAGTRYRVSAWLSYPGGRPTRLRTTVTFGRRQAAAQQRYGGAPRASGGGTAWWKIALAVAVALYALATTTLLLRRRMRPASDPRQ
jgi:hypothetical protein